MEGRYKNYIDKINIGELTENEAIQLMNKLPGLQNADPNIKEKIFNLIGGHPYTINLFSLNVRRSSIKEVIYSISDVNDEMIDFTLLEKVYGELESNSKEILKFSSVYNEPVPILALQKIIKVNDISEVLDELIHWGLIKKIDSTENALYQIHTLVKEFIKKKLI